ncbi:MAG: xylulokinase [Promethearchaeota archaeon]
MDYYAALDLGTTGVRTIIFDKKGREVSSSYKECQSFFPSSTMVEQDANVWWDSLRKTIRVALSKGKIEPKKIKSVAITNQRETIVPVDEKGEPLSNAIVWQDRRTTDECEEIRSNIGEEKVYKITGLKIDPYFSGSKIMWIKKNKPNIYNLAYKFLLVHDFIVHKLTGQWITDYSNASRTMLFDINTLKWSDDLASAMEIDLDKMPEAIPSGKLISKITSEETVFSKDTVVISGGGDQQCAALGVGVVKEGITKCTTGTGSFIVSYLDKPVFDEKRRVLCSCHTVPGAWIQEASIFTTGSVLKWVRDVISHEEVEIAKKNGVNTYQIMDELAEKSPVGANGLLLIPHFMGAGSPYWNPNAKGVLFGMTLAHKRADIIRAVMEGVTFEIRKNIELFNELGTEINEIRITGGGARSNIWNQILADVCNVTCGKGEIEESTSIGAMILAAYGVGDYKSLVDASEKLSNISKKWYPNADNLLTYSRIYKTTKDLYNAIDYAGIYKKLDA